MSSNTSQGAPSPVRRCELSGVSALHPWRRALAKRSKAMRWAVMVCGSCMVVILKALDRACGVTVSRGGA